jgi:class 3 adenylate cyclase
VSALPSGTVTFLFTDIEGSTRLLRQLRDRYRSVIAAHGELLRAAFSLADGEVVDTQGDAGCTEPLASAPGRTEGKCCLHRPLPRCSRTRSSRISACAISASIS